MSSSVNGVSVIDKLISYRIRGHPTITIFLKVSVYSTKAKRRKLIYFQGQRLKSLDLRKAYLYLNKCGQDLTRTTDSVFLKVRVYTTKAKRKKPIYFQGQRIKSLDFKNHFETSIFVGRIEPESLILSFSMRVHILPM